MGRYTEHLDNKNLSINLRTDPVILKLVKFIGLKKAQGKFSNFEIRIFPKKFLKQKITAMMVLPNLKHRYKYRKLQIIFTCLQVRRRKI